MSLLTEQEIYEMANNDALWDDGKHLGEATLNEYRYARAVEAKARAMLIEEIKAQGPLAHLCTNVQSGDLDATVLDPQDVFDWNEQAAWHLEPLYRLPEGD